MGERIDKYGNDRYIYNKKQEKGVTICITIARAVRACWKTVERAKKYIDKKENKKERKGKWKKKQIYCLHCG